MSNTYNATSTQQPAAICALKSPADAILILEAVKANLVPRVTRRLTGHERSMIRPGTVWVWEEEETNMRRWTDGRRWGASRVGGGGFLVYTESSESLSPPPSQGMNPYNPDFYQQPRKTESLIKQTYSTSMKTSSGKPKRFHVVAYSSKFNPQGEAHNPLPLPHQLPLLADIKIQPSNWPEWEQQRSTTEAYARRPPPGVTLSPSNNNNNNGSSSAASVPQINENTPANSYPTRLPTPPNNRDLYHTSATSATGAYPDPSYLSRDPYDRRNQQPYPQQPYGSDRYQPYSMGPITPTDWYGNGNPNANGNNRRERSPPPRGDPVPTGLNNNYLQTPYPYYPRDRYAETSPSYMPYGQPIDYRSPEIRMYEAIDTKPSLLPQPAMTRLPLTPNSANPDLPNGTGPSPKLSINNTLLNPSDLNGQTGASATGPGLTLPPLRMTLDDGNSQGGINGRKSPNGQMLPKEDAQQLDGLGRRAY